MFVTRLATAIAVFAAALPAAPATAASTAGAETTADAAAARACAITSPPEGWPGGGIPGYNTRLHMGHNNDWRNQVRPIGDVRAIMLFVDFPNAPAVANPAPHDQPGAYYDFLVPESTAFFRQASFGQFRLTVDAPRRWYRMDKNDADYGMGYIVSPETQATYIAEAIRHADSDVDFSKYTHIYVVPPRNAKAIPFSPEWNDYRGVVGADGKIFKNGVTFGQDAWYWGYKILNHETGHDIGLPEDYNATGQGPTFKFTGGWDVMGKIRGHAPDFFAWEKWKLGWLRDHQIGCLAGKRGSTTRLLSPVETPGGTKAIVVRTGRYTAWVAEVRQKVGVDAEACDRGVLVHHLDVSIPNGGGNIRVHDANPATAVCGDPLNDAPLDVGPGEVSTFHDPATGTTIEVLRAIGDHYLVRATTAGAS